MPLGHSPDVDLVAEVDHQLLRIQVKTSIQEIRTPDGHARFPVVVATRGGNQSWNRVVKQLDPLNLDYLFVLTGGGRRWFIPSGAIDAGSAIQLGGPKYSEHEIETCQPIPDLISGEAKLESGAAPGEYPRGQRMAAVNRPAQSFAGSTPASPISTDRRIRPTNYERKPGQRGQATINQKRRLTIPQKPFFEAGFANGGRVRVRADGPGRLAVEQIELPNWAKQPAGAERLAP